MAIFCAPPVVLLPSILADALSAAAIPHSAFVLDLHLGMATRGRYTKAAGLHPNMGKAAEQLPPMVARLDGDKVDLIVTLNATDTVVCRGSTNIVRIHSDGRYCATMLNAANAMMVRDVIGHPIFSQQQALPKTVEQSDDGVVEIRFEATMCRVG